MSYIISVDQSTQGTKALLFNDRGSLFDRTDLPHKQIVNVKAWVSHNPIEIYENTVKVIKSIIEKNKINKNEVISLGISNQRETTVLWDRDSHKPLDNAIVWQCQRATEICNRDNIKKHSDEIRNKTGIVLSPYFPAGKIAWLLENAKPTENICHGTIDSWLVFKLTGGKSYKTDYSNASRTQLFNIFDLKWDEEICSWFGIDIENLAEVVDSNALFGYTDLEGFFDKEIPIQGVMGDSHSALFGQGCLKSGMIKSTYGTGSSVMMNIGDKPILSKNGIVTSLAFGFNGEVNYVLEGNINYTGAVITWLKDDMKMIESPTESEELAIKSNKNDSLYLVPAFSGLGAPYWDSEALASVVGMDRTTGRSEFVRAGLESIAYQISDIVFAMEEDSGVKVSKLCVDGGPTRNKYLMQFQSDIINSTISLPCAEELSGIGVAYMIGITLGLFDEKIFEKMDRVNYESRMKDKERNLKLIGWKNAVKSVLKEIRLKKGSV